eukprot:SAG31_NODE_7304_length_1724_cov_1.875692_2_plen_161_part_00
MSVIDVDRLTVNSCTFRNTSGVAPQAGVDLEPDDPSQRLSNILFTNCSFTANKGAGFQVVPAALDARSEPIGVVLRKSTASDNLYGFAVIYGSPERGGYFASGSRMVVDGLHVASSKQEGLGLVDLSAPPGEDLLVLKDVTLMRSGLSPDGCQQNPPCPG